MIDGRKPFITSAAGASVGILMACTDYGDGRMAATMFMVDLPQPSVTIERVIDMTDSSMPGGHSEVAIEGLRMPSDAVLNEVHEGFRYARVRLSPARLSHCMRWLGLCVRANEFATDYACRRQAFGKTLIDHEGVGFMLAENLIDIKQAELMIDGGAEVLDCVSLGTAESSMTKVAVSEASIRIADRSVQVMSGTGVSGDTIV